MEMPLAIMIWKLLTTWIAMGFLGNATMNKIIDSSTINNNDDHPMLDVTNYLEGLGGREASERI
jgi:hypothetical protein